ncbi:hypothetical protein PanNE5_12890 [Pandoraea sp. NE5]|nr:hypothetical protein PanNE5_12890 [Pandoraea sp. NE5]
MPEQRFDASRHAERPRFGHGDEHNPPLADQFGQLSKGTRTEANIDRIMET